MDIADDPDGWDAVGDAREDSGPEGGTADTATEMLGALTAKQRAVLDLLIQHKTSKEISRLLGISPHTVDQRIMLARAKLNVVNRGEVAQAYRQLLENERNSAIPGVYERSIYGYSDVAPPPAVPHSGEREDAVANVRPLPFGTARPAMAGATGEEFDEPYYHVLPEMFDGPHGTLLRLGAIALIAVFLVLIVLGGLAMFVQLSHMVDL